MTSHLRRELRELDVENVEAVPAEEVPSGTRAFGVMEIGALLVTLGQSATALRQVAGVLHGWWSRFQEARPSMRLTMDGDVLELSEATPDQVAEAFEAFINKHSSVEA
ncbi:hypothetical protein E2C00_14495 [Streptomyces sp. WAC05374]|uniref:hypothetical protein n=1 Tax=Streptomyces sp. WAC05374 TaxID=2487420 RepID=UPI000F8665B4|nr:hypothetical protein [Streptomyces sp. WAC05374]RST13152.1 hypothetical protein EF905_20965 [Streptomyces sp. WAC05374]TDF48288.1 hypothetical protein E2B92_05220 [Streptomyces sp. WAC05374]TDF49259.1 hypothetical protein E2C02_27290 [Streptomyces sp. WAC05374]TDF55221.1 hypothetical protein E2C00_14495 [Streptomyces sp. WAC05374]